MKPVNLKLKNIGPYRDQELDFTKLENMFLITGNTGAGKTFIFDAMTFALYGLLNGGREGTVYELKSRLAEESEESYVDFAFEIGDEIYRCYRKVPYHYTNRNGNKSTKNQSVDLFKMEDGQWVCISQKKSITETDNAIEKLIGLSAAEFSKIVLLPQGQFSKFLKQNSNDRKITLQKIFPVLDYTYLMEIVKNKKNDAEKILNDKLAVIKAAEKEFDYSNAENQIKICKDEIEILSEDEKIILQRQKESSAKLVEIERDLEEAKKNEENIKELNQLKSKKTEFDKLNEIIRLAEEAFTLSAPLKTKKDSENRFLRIQNELVEKKESLDKISIIFNELNKKSDFIKEVEESVKQNNNQLSGIKEKLKNQEEYTQCVNDYKKYFEEETKYCAELKDVENQLFENEKKLKNQNVNEYIDNLNIAVNENNNRISEIKILIEKALKRDNLKTKESELVQEIKQLESQILENKKEEENEQKEIDELGAKIEDVKSKNSAFLLTSLLKPECPCPVCGSLNHPSPAKEPEQLSDEIKLFEQKNKTLKYIKESIETSESSLEVNKKILEDINSQLEAFIELKNTSDLENEKLSAEIEKEKLDDELQNIIKLRNEIEELKEEKERCLKKAKDAETQVKIVVEKKELLEKQLGDSVENLLAREQILRELIEKDEKTIDEWKNEFNEVQKNKIAGETNVKNLKENLLTSQKEFEEAEKELLSAVEKSLFESVESVENAFIEQEELLEKKEEYKEYMDRLSLYTDLVKKGKKLESSEKIQNAYKQEEDKLKIEEEKYTKIKLSLDEKKSFYNAYKAGFEKIRNTQKEYEDLKKEVEPLYRLNDDLSGKNPQKLPFDSWALGMYFEQVVEFASDRFEQISGGRFRFKLQDLGDDIKGNSFRGLDLQIWDLNTDELADPKTLSGGETFEASISLALALTDVVQSSKGGIKLDSLFIDEGFGTLDPEALDKAMSVFTELGETKMVGIISHVEGLQTLIPSSINVTKTKSGSSIEIR